MTAAPHSLPDPARLAPSWLGVFVIWLVYAGPLVWSEGNLYLADTAPIDVPRRIYAAEQIRGATFPWWTPLLACGFPLTAEGQTGIFYPGFLLYVGWPTPKAHDVFVALHYLIAGLGMASYLRGRGLGQLASVWGASVFMTAPALQWVHAAVARLVVLAWIPTALWLWDRVAEGRRRSLSTLALVNALMILAGSYDTALVLFTLQGAYACLVLHRVFWPLRWLMPAAVFVAAACLTAVQLVPLYQYFEQSNRAQQPAAMIRLRWDQFWQPGQQVYDVADASLPRALAGAAANGFLVGCLAISLVLALRNRWLRMWMALGLAGLLLAAHTPLSDLLDHLPVYSWFRWASMYLSWWVLAVAVVSAFGADALAASASAADAPLRAPCRALLPLGLLLLATSQRLDLYLSHENLYDQVGSRLARLATAGEHTRLWSMSPLEANESRQLRLSESLAKRALQSAPADYNLLFELPSAQLYSQDSTVSPRWLVELYRALPGGAWQRSARLAAVTHQAIAPGPGHDLLDPRWRPLAQRPVRLLRASPTHPRAWLVGETKLAADSDDRLALLRSDQFDPERQAVIERPLPTALSATDWPSQVMLRQLDAGNLLVEVETSSAALLVVADSYCDDVCAWVDGQRCDVLRTNHAFLGVPISAGRHRVVISHWPSGLWLGLIVSLLALALVATILILAGRDRSPSAKEA